MAKQRTSNQFWSQLCQLLLDKAFKNRFWRKSCEAIYFILTDLAILCVLYVQFISPSIVWYNRTQGMLELWRNHSRQKRKINLQIFQIKKNNALYHVMLKLKFYEGTNITCAVCIHKEYFQWWAMQCHAMQSSPLLRYAVQIYFFIFLSTRDSPVTLLPKLHCPENLGYPIFGMQLVWQSIGEDRQTQAATQLI